MIHAKKIKELFIGEMFFIDPDASFMHSYYEVLGQKHEEKLVIYKNVPTFVTQYSHNNEIQYLDYDTEVFTRPDAPMCIREELRKNWEPYKKWPYDIEGNFSFTPWDWTVLPPSPVITS
jgi:hypothetical protein